MNSPEQLGGALGVFVFAESSFSGIIGLVITIGLLFTVRYMIHQEERRTVEEPGAPARATGRPAPVGAGAHAPSSP